MDLQLDGKSALVTGSSRGIGRAIAAALLAEGAHVCLCARKPEELERTREELQHAAGKRARVVAIAADVATEEGARRSVQHCISELGGLNVLVNNVGGSRGAGTFDATTTAQFREVVLLGRQARVADFAQPDWTRN